MTKQDYVTFIKEACLLYKQDPDLMCAIVNTESHWKPDVSRYEKNYGYLWQPAKFAALEGITIETESVLQKMSFGLVQLMGANARWLGFDKPLMKLLDPKTNIDLGVQFFRKRCDVYPDLKDKIAAYNFGSPVKKDGVYLNQSYVDKVYQYYCEQKKQGT